MRWNRSSLVTLVTAAGLLWGLHAAAQAAGVAPVGTALPRGLPLIGFFRSSRTYWLLPLLFCIFSLVAGFWLHQRRVQAAARAFPDAPSLASLWGPSFLAHVLLLAVPTLLFLYLVALALPEYTQAYGRYGSAAVPATLVAWLVPVVVAVLLTLGRKR